MPSRTATRRRVNRYAVSPDVDAHVAFDYPSPNGRRFRLPIKDFSVSGVSFFLEPESSPVVESGTNLGPAVVCIGDCEIHAELVVIHITESDSEWTCGAFLYPESDTELVKLKSLIAGMDAVGKN